MAGARDFGAHRAERCRPRCNYYNLFAQKVLIQEGLWHPQIALEQALVFNFCGKYGDLSPVVDSGRFLLRDKWPTDQTFSETIVAKYGVGRAVLRGRVSSAF